MEDITERRRNYMQRMDNFNQAAMRRNQKSPKEIIEEGIEKSTGVSEKEILDQLAEKILQDSIKEKDASHDVFLFGIAESLESIRCETTSQNEYFSWIDDAKKIMDHMHDGFVSFQDIREKENFVKMSWQRETELLTCLALYEKSNHPLAKERHAELMIKLQRLRQIRSALLVGTKNKTDQRPLTPAEKARLARYIKSLQDMEECDSVGDYHNLALLEQLQELQISHMHDIEFYYGGYSFYQRMLEEQRRAESHLENQAIERLYSYLSRPDEYLDELRHKDDSKDNIRLRIQELTGRRTVFRNNVQGQKIHDRVQTFDAQRYRKLRENLPEMQS
ncbi:MAG: hypothetical protein IJ660_02815 [Alphaproteobacteria bacterium]|nr:hypothetical protein [Alphaproteobacteria bacterium]